MLGQKLAVLSQDIATGLLDQLRGRLAESNDASFSRWIDYLLSDENRSTKGVLKTIGELHTLWFVEPDIAASLKTAAAIEL